MIVPFLETVTATLLAVAGFLFLLRIVRGSSSQDRILALEGLGLTVVGYLLFRGRGTGVNDLDAALTLALLSFVATLALARATESRHER